MERLVDWLYGPNDHLADFWNLYSEVDVDKKQAAPAVVGVSIIVFRQSMSKIVL